MIIQSLHIDHFGKWNGLRLQNLETGINLFYGPNETGKTTLMQFLRTIFYGFSEDRLSYVFQPAPEKTGGEIQVQTSLGQLVVSRHLTPHFGLDSKLDINWGADSVHQKNSKFISKDENRRQKNEKSKQDDSELPFYVLDSFRDQFRTRSLEDGLLITNEKGVGQDVSEWRNLLNLTGRTNVNLNETASELSRNNLEMDETLFNNIFALGLQELQKLSVLDSTEAAKRLYDLSTGVLKYSTVKILAQLSQNRQIILAENAIPETLKIEDLQWCNEISSPLFLRKMMENRQGSPQEILALLNYRLILQKQQENIHTQNKKYGKFYTERSHLNDKIQTLTEKIQQTRHKIHILEIAQDINDVWNQRADLDSQIIAFTTQNPELADSSEATIEKISKSQRKIEKLLNESKSIHSERTEIQKELESQKLKLQENSPNWELIQSLPVIESLIQQREWIENLRGRLDNLHRLRLDSEAQLAIDYRRIGIPIPDLKTVHTPENLFPYNTRTLRPLRSPSRELRRIRKQVQTEKKRRQELLNEARENTQNISAYFCSCRNRLELFPQIRDIPGMESFPEMFLLSQKDKTDQYNSTQESDSINTNHNINSKILDEIPPQIFSSTPASDTNHANECSSLITQNNLNALSVFLGELLTNTRRSEMYVSQLIQTLKKLFPLYSERKESLTKRILPVRELFVLGGVFTLGLTLIFFESLRLTGVLPSMEQGISAFLTHLFLFVIGITLCFACVAYRVVFSQKTEKKIADINDSLSATLQQRSRLVRLVFGSKEDEILNLSDSEIIEISSIESEKKASQIDFLEKELKEAEKTMLSSSRRSALLHEAKQHTVRLRKLFQSYTQTKARRAGILKSLKLPENWKAENIRVLLDASDRIQELWRRRSRDLEDFQLYSQELQLFVERLQKLLPIFGPDFPEEMKGGDESFPFIPGIFTEIQSRIQKEKEREGAFRKIQKEITARHVQLRKLKAEYKRRTSICSQLLENSGVNDEKDLKARLEQLNTLKELRNKRRDFQKQIDSVVEFSCTESLLWEVYENNSLDQIEEKRKILQNTLNDCEFQLENAQKREKECSEILEKIISDDSPTRIQYALLRTNAQIGHAINSWRTFAMTERLVETIQRTYQLKRQPRTLECASFFLREMTDGKYERVWTPLDEDVLYVQRTDGVVFSPGQLSTGTRELLYLAIRLALIDEYRQRNIHLPIILDDILVNFDRVRAESAARVLTQFAGNQTQIFFFTSHEHIREIFLKGDALICDMDKRKTQGSF